MTTNAKSKFELSPAAPESTAIGADDGMAVEHRSDIDWIARLLDCEPNRNAIDIAIAELLGKSAELEKVKMILDEEIESHM